MVLQQPAAIAGKQCHGSWGADDDREREELNLFHLRIGFGSVDEEWMSALFISWMNGKRAIKLEILLSN